MISHQALNLSVPFPAVPLAPGQEWASPQAAEGRSVASIWAGERGLHIHFSSMGLGSCKRSRPVQWPGGLTSLPRSYSTLPSTHTLPTLWDGFPEREARIRRAANQVILEQVLTPLPHPWLAGHLGPAGMRQREQ